MALVVDSGRIYLDYAASAPLKQCAKDAWMVAHSYPGNPSSSHEDGGLAANLLSDARQTIGRFLGENYEVVFTSGGTESIILGILTSLEGSWSQSHVVTTSIEHSAVLGLLQRLEQAGVAVTLVDPQPNGVISPNDVANALRPDTRLVCIQHANNETGVIQPVNKVAELLSGNDALLFVDAVQTAGKLPLPDVDADLLAVSAHKFGGPRGVGALRIRPGLALRPLIAGVSHENGFRAGTQNVAGIVAMAAAAQECMNYELTPAGRRHLRRLRGYWEEGISRLPFEVRTISNAPTLFETLCILIPGLRGDTVADALDLLGISVSTGSACHSSEEGPSHVLSAMGLDKDTLMSAIRISFGSSLVEDEIDRSLAALESVVVRLETVAGIR